MGDDCNVVPRQREDSPSSSSSKLGAPIKDLEEPRVGDISDEERDIWLLGRQSGEPGEEMYKISDNKHIADNDLPQSDELATTEPLLFVPSSLVKSTISVFPYFETKLRPDAPPFTPESLARSGPAACGIVEINDNLCLEPNFIPRGAIDDSCYVNIELRSNAGNDVASSYSPKMEKPLGRENHSREYRETMKEPEFKTIDVTSTPNLKRSMPMNESSIDSIPINAEIVESIVVATESRPNESNVNATRPDALEPRILRGHWRIIRTACILSNRIQIVVFIASLIICMILVIYVVA